MRKATFILAAVLAFISAISCNRCGSSRKSSEYIPDNTPLVLVTNPDQILSQSGIGHNYDLLDKFELPHDFPDNLDRYGVDSKEDIFFFIVNRSACGLVTVLDNPELFLDRVDEYSDALDRGREMLVQDGIGFRIHDGVLLLVFDENAEDEEIRDILRDLHKNKGRNEVNDNEFFKEMLDEPSVLGVWMQPKMAINALRGTEFSELAKYMKMTSSYLKGDGALYCRVLSEDGLLRVESAGDFLDDELIEDINSYKGNHLRYIPKDADLVIGCSLDGDFISDILMKTDLKSQVDMLRMMGIDLWEFFDAIDGDMTVSLNSFVMKGKNEVPDIDATVMFDVDDKEDISDFLSRLHSKFSSMSRKLEDNSYMVSLDDMGQLNYGLKGKTLYFSLSRSEFGKNRKNFDFDHKNARTIGLMTIKAGNMDRSLMDFLEKESGLDLSFFDSLEFYSELDGHIIRQNADIHLKNDANPLQLLVGVIENFM